MLALVVGVAAGCGSGPGTGSGTRRASSPPTASPEVAHPGRPVTAAPANGQVLHGSGYRVQVPANWHQVTHRRLSNGVDRAAGAALPVHGFASNLSVVVTPDGFAVPELAAVTRRIRARMGRAGPQVSILPQAQIAGMPAGHLAGLRKKSGTTYWLDQYVVAHGGHGYVVSFAFSPSVRPAKRKQLIASVLGTWTWRR